MKFKVKKIIFLFLSLLAILTPVYSTNINSCQTISSSGIYILNTSISTTGTCFTISANNTELDLNGYLIDGDDGASDYGITASTNLTNITIRNGSVQDFGTGVYFNDNTKYFNLTLNNITFLSNNLDLSLNAHNTSEIFITNSKINGGLNILNLGSFYFDDTNTFNSTYINMVDLKSNPYIITFKLNSNITPSGSGMPILIDKVNSVIFDLNGYTYDNSVGAWTRTAYGDMNLTIKNGIWKGNIGDWITGPSYTSQPPNIEILNATLNYGSFGFSYPIVNRKINIQNSFFINKTGLGFNLNNCTMNISNTIFTNFTTPGSATFSFGTTTNPSKIYFSNNYVGSSYWFGCLNAGDCTQLSFIGENNQFYVWVLFRSLGNHGNFTNNLFNTSIEISNSNTLNFFQNNVSSGTAFSRSAITTQNYIQTINSSSYGNLWRDFTCSNSSNNYSTTFNGYLYTACNSNDYVSNGITDTAPLIVNTKYFNFNYVTAPNGSTNDTNYAFINATSDIDISSCYLNWSGNLFQMTVLGQYCYINKSDTWGAHNYFIIATSYHGLTNTTSTTNITFQRIFNFNYTSYLNGTINQTWALINASSDINISNCYLNWSGTLVNMTTVNNYCYINQTFSYGTHNYYVIGTSYHNATNNTETKNLTLELPISPAYYLSPPTPLNNVNKYNLATITILFNDGNLILNNCYVTINNINYTMTYSNGNCSYNYSVPASNLTKQIITFQGFYNISNTTIPLEERTITIYSTTQTNSNKVPALGLYSIILFLLTLIGGLVFN